jgi:beta-fructofuranosidase
MQLDIEVVFEYPNVSIVGESEKNLDEHFECGQGGAQARGTFGPFGLLLLADKNLTELSAVFFYISHVKNAGWTTRFCADPTRCDNHRPSANENLPQYCRKELLKMFVNYLPGFFS